jgi:hypothetical protein
VCVRCVIYVRSWQVRAAGRLCVPSLVTQKSELWSTP